MVLTKACRCRPRVTRPPPPPPAMPPSPSYLSWTALLLAPLKESEARATFRLAVGDAEDDGTGFSVSLNVLHKGNGAGWRFKEIYL